MIHTWHCKKCDKEYTTSCYSMTISDGHLVDSWKVVSYRRQTTSRLCSKCFVELEKNPDPVFELLFNLEEKQRWLSSDIQELQKFYESRIVRSA